MQIFPSKSECCGCSACKQICPKGAIAMKPDSEGFLYPQIDVSLCIESAPAKKYAHFRTVMKRTIQRQHMQSSIKTLILALQAAAVLHL